LSFCGGSNPTSTCSSANGNNYAVTCGVEYEGTVIDTSGIDGTSKKAKRAIEPTFQACQALCDQTAGCVALNYVGTNCTLLSSVTGIDYVPGAVGASITAGADDSPTCPGAANKMFTDIAGITYGLGCYTDYAGNNIGNPLQATSFAACLAYCDPSDACVGVEFNVGSQRCNLKSSFSGTQISNTNIIYGMKNRAVPAPSGVASVNPTLTPSTTLCEYSSRPKDR
jgi:hypothetical protein